MCTLKKKLTDFFFLADDLTVFFPFSDLCARKLRVSMLMKSTQGEGYKIIKVGQNEHPWKAQVHLILQLLIRFSQKHSEENFYKHRLYNNRHLFVCEFVCVR